MLSLLTEKEFEPTSWCGEILRGLKLEKSRKKLQIQKVNAVKDLIKDNAAKENLTVFLVGTSAEWLQSNITELNKIGVSPILLSNSQKGGLQGSYSYVSSDIFGTLKSAFKIMKNSGKKSIALYGINPDSFADMLRQKAFLECGGKPADIFFNNGSLKEMFNDFSNADFYDGIICANDFTAVSLLNYLKLVGVDYEKYFIISCVDSVLCENFTPKISAFKVNFSHFGKTGISLYESMLKNPKLSSVNALIGYDFISRATTKNAVTDNIIPDAYNSFTSPSTSIYSDGELSEIMSAESLLRNLESSDLIILKELNKGSNYEKISDVTYLSLSAVKYRIKNMCKALNVSSPQKMLEIIKKYYKL